MAARHQDGADTRASLVSIAGRLFATVGYEGTSVQAIIDGAGVAKGTFYHHFASKEAILDAVAEQLALAAVAELHPIAEDPSLRAIDKMCRFLLAVRQFRVAHLPLIRETTRLLLSDENTIVVRKIQRRNVALAAPLLAQIVRQGVVEGVFDTPDPREAAEALLHLTSALAEKNARILLESDDWERRIDEITARVRFAVDAAERIIGAPRGSLQVYGNEALEVVLRAFREGSLVPGAEQ